LGVTTIQPAFACNCSKGDTGNLMGVPLSSAYLSRRRRQSVANLKSPGPILSLQVLLSSDPCSIRSGSGSRASLRRSSARRQVKYRRRDSEAPRNAFWRSQRGRATGGSQDALGGGRVFRKRRGRSARTRQQFAATVRAAPLQKRSRAIGAERAFKRADQRIGTICRQIAVTAFAIGSELQHLDSSIDRRPGAWLELARTGGVS